MIAQPTEQRNQIALVPYEGHQQAEYICPTTMRPYRPLAFRYQATGGERFVWCYCSICDTYRRTRQDKDYDPLSPQAHCYTLVGGP